MNLSRLSIPAAAYSTMLFWAAIIVVPLAAFLSFSVQPLVGRLLLPVQGGAASTWLGTMLYFQITLLLGYSWAAWLLRRRLRLQVAATAGLALAALVGSQLPSVPASQRTGIDGILLTLTFTTLPAMILLFSSGPLMHGWLRRRGQPVPYHLYAYSTAGGLAAVLLYPFIIERAVSLSDQMVIWRGLLWVLADLVIIAGLCLSRTGMPDPGQNEVAESISARRVGKWIGLSALTCLGMLGATHHLAAEIGSTPLAWVGPFGVYLLSFLVVFSGRWEPRFTLVCLGWMAISLTGFMLTKGVRSVNVDGPAAFWLLSLTAAGSFFGNGLLYESRPNERFAFFYLILAAGGVAGGLFASLGAPFFFLRPSEFLVVSFVLLTFGLLRLVARRDWLTVAVVVLIVAAPVVGLSWMQTREDAPGASRVRRYRNVYGYMALLSVRNGLVLENETIKHGSQITHTPEARRRPTLYYTESTGLGRLIEETQKASPSIYVGVIGLGAGTIAAYARPADQIDFWDIDPKVIRVARDFFTFVADSPGRIEIAPTDGRKGLEASPRDYNVIVIDAFSGDGVPPHLLTREALATYFQRLDRRQGILAIHATNRYSNVFPIVGATAHTLGWTAVKVVTEISEDAAARDWDHTQTEYILVCRPAQLPQVSGWLPAEEDEGRVKRTVTPYVPEPPGSTIVWTDDRHAALDSLDLQRYLFPQ